MMDTAQWLLDREFEIGLWINLDLFEYFIEGERLCGRFKDYYTPTEWHKLLLAFPRALPIELKGIAV